MEINKSLSGFSKKNLNRWLDEILTHTPSFVRGKNNINLLSIDVNWDGAGSSISEVSLSVDNNIINVQYTVPSTDLLEAWLDWVKKYDINDVEHFGTEEELLYSIIDKKSISKEIERCLTGAIGIGVDVQNILLKYNILKVLESNNSVFREEVLTLPSNTGFQEIDNHIRLIKEFVNLTEDLVKKETLESVSKIWDIRNECKARYVNELHYTKFQNTVLKSIKEKYFNEQYFTKKFNQNKFAHSYPLFVEYIQCKFLHFDKYHKCFTQLKLGKVNKKLQLNVNKNNRFEVITVLQNLSKTTSEQWYNNLIK